MKTYDSSCNFSELVKYDAFTVERHALQVRQPMVEYEENKFHVACEMGRAKTHRWGRIDFSRGYPEWWFLSHIDFHVPSEHTLEGTRFDAEMQMQHFYSTANSSTGLDNEMATVAIFLQVFNETDSHDYYMLNKIICQWRRHEDGVRNQCGLPSVLTEYKGCSMFDRTTSIENVTNAILNGTNATRRLYGDLKQKVKPRRKSWTANDLFVHNHRRTRINASFIPATIQLKPHDFEEPEDDWEEIVQEVYRREEEMKHGRHLMDYESVGPYHTYFGMHGVKTDYYYRYSGSQTIPPCYGTYQQGSRKGTNHWRIMKDPIKMTQRQIDEMHRLLKERIAPIDDLIRPCQPDTAAGVYDGDDTKVNVSRPLMQTTGAHYQTFCECQDWNSHWQEDQDWCELDQMTRYYAQPYNYVTNGF
ncbi:hypothetical protein MPSEU_000688600 [Mayamaea pseudoterrestris]|nr:hypothetical protein MPSEU_000688600 [Mayamaea pseudoterrestris]